MSDEKIAYIYIMTNKSFQKNWVKIGYATNPERRRKELSNTSLPFEYEIYATYEIPAGTHMGDKALHSLIQQLNPNLRLAANREFFLMLPEEAYDLLRAIAIIHDREDKLSKGPFKSTITLIPPAKTSSTSILSDEKIRSNTENDQTKTVATASANVFTIKTKGILATLVYDGGFFILKSGSQVHINLSPTNPQCKLQDEDLKSGILSSPVNGISKLTVDKSFKSPSGAAKYVNGYSTNGWISWKNDKNVLIKDALEK